MHRRQNATPATVPTMPLAKMRRVELSQGIVDVCNHPVHLAGMCAICGKILDDDQPSVALGYIHAKLSVSDDEITRLQGNSLKNSLRHKKLYLVLDLDHTLLNSTSLQDITANEEGYLNGLKKSLPETLFRVDQMQMMTKLRPFVHTFLKEASKSFEMSIYTMGERRYASQMVKLLDPDGVYFNGKVIAREDCTERNRKGLDVFLGRESAVVILDDTEGVWEKHKENLIVMGRYHYFATSCRQFGLDCKSHSELRSDESESDGALATVLETLKRIHRLFFDEERKDRLEDRDVRRVIRTVCSRANN